MAIGDSVQQGDDDTFMVRRRLFFVDAARVQQDGAALKRRSYYVYTVTAAAFGLILGVLVFKPEESLARSIVEGSFSLIEIVAVAYLGANVVDRTKLVDRISRTPSRFSPLGGPLTPEQSNNVFGGPPPGLGSPYS